MPDLMHKSPYGTFLEHCKKGELAYQVNADDGDAASFQRGHCAPPAGVNTG